MQSADAEVAQLHEDGGRTTVKLAGFSLLLVLGRAGLPGLGGLSGLPWGRCEVNLITQHRQRDPSLLDYGFAPSSRKTKTQKGAIVSRPGSLLRAFRPISPSCSWAGAQPPNPGIWRGQLAKRPSGPGNRRARVGRTVTTTTKLRPDTPEQEAIVERPFP
jgi:hypothetical protein